MDNSPTPPPSQAFPTPSTSGGRRGLQPQLDETEDDRDEDLDSEGDDDAHEVSVYYDPPVVPPVVMTDYDVA